MRADKQAQRDRETILKAHAHYQRAELDSPPSRRRGLKAAPPVPLPVEKEDGAGTTSGSKRRRGKKSDTKEKGKEREQAPPPPIKGGAKGGQKPPTVLKSKDVPKEKGASKGKDVSKEKELPKERETSKEKEVAKDRPIRVAQATAGSRSLQLALSGLGIKKAAEKGPKPASTTETQNNGTSTTPIVTVTSTPASTAKDKVESKPENTQAQIPRSPGRRSGRRRGDGAKSPSRVTSQAQKTTAGLFPYIKSLTFVTNTLLQRQQSYLVPLQSYSVLLKMLSKGELTAKRLAERTRVAGGADADEGVVAAQVVETRLGVVHQVLKLCLFPEMRLLRLHDASKWIMGQFSIMSKHVPPLPPLARLPECLDVSTSFVSCLS